MGRRRLAVLKIVLLILTCSVVLVSCPSPFLETIAAVVEQYSTPVPTIDFEDGSGIAQTTAITITYTETIDTTTLALSGILSGESDGGTWSTTTNTDDTLTISPSSAWSTGSGKTLEVTCSDFEGYPVTVSVTYGVLDGVVYVRTPGDGGSDGNPGTSDQPKATIQDAINTAAAVYPSAEVHVAEGNYTPAAIIDGKNGISLLGGYSATDWTLRETDIDWALTGDSAYPTNIETSTSVAVRFSNTSTALIVEGFYIDGDVSGSSTTGVYFDTSSNITLRRNKIDAGGGDFSVAVTLVSSSVDLEWNDITGGDDGDSTAVLCNNATASITNNVIQGGSSGTFGFTQGIYCFGTSGSIAYNQIYGGDAWNSSTAIVLGTGSDMEVYNNVIDAGLSNFGPSTTGIYIDASDPIIRNNTINGGTVPLGDSTDGSEGITVINSSAPTIENNIIITETSAAGVNRYGITASTGTVFTSLKNNDFFDCPDGLFAWIGNPYTEVLLSGINALSNAGSNISVDPMFVNQAAGNWHLQSGSLVIDLGLDGDSEGWSFDDDLDGNDRSTTGTSAWCIGAYEYAP